MEVLKEICKNEAEKVHECFGVCGFLQAGFRDIRLLDRRRIRRLAYILKLVRECRSEHGQLSRFCHERNAGQDNAQQWNDIVSYQFLRRGSRYFRFRDDDLPAGERLASERCRSRRRSDGHNPGSIPAFASVERFPENRKRQDDRVLVFRAGKQVVYGIRDPRRGVLL